MMSELPLATAMALMKLLVPPAPLLMLIHATLVGDAIFTSTLRQRLLPPASIVLGLFGSRMNGAMKFAATGAFGSSSSSPAGEPASGSALVVVMALSLTAPLELR